jgi:hypothetical protein
MKKSKARQRIHKMRGKYKHLDLVKGLIDAREEERQIPVANWQKELLGERQQRIDAGEAKFSDWESAKKRIRERTS